MWTMLYGTVLRSLWLYRSITCEHSCLKDWFAVFGQNLGLFDGWNLINSK